MIPRPPRPAALAGVALTIVATTTSPAGAAGNLVLNPSVESLDAAGFPTCFARSGWGDNTFTTTTTDQARTGDVALQIAVDAISSGDRKVMMRESPDCAPPVEPDHQYDLSVWYTSTTPNTAMTVFRHDVEDGWQYWIDLATLPPTGAWSRATVRTPPVPAGTDQITWGVSIYGVGMLRTDDYGMVDVTPPPPEPGCTAGEACTRGAWEVLTEESPARAIHTVLLHTGKVLLVAGSGNDPDAFEAGTFTTALYDPATGALSTVPTPVDLFCAGHVHLPDGRILIMGGNKAYPEESTAWGYAGLRDSFVFDPVTEQYSRVNDLSAGHWYPSATALGNGDVLSLGGLGEDTTGTVATEYWSHSQNRWLALHEANQTWRFWGLYPAMILLQDGRLFYTGSHVFGNGLPGTGASIYDYATGTVTDVPGLRRKDERDQSMSVLLPPAQAQRVWTVGGGNIDTNPDAHRLTDLVDLTEESPAYEPGPLLPRGTLAGGVHQAEHQGKMYVSAVILPDGKVFETGGGLHNRADPVYEASMYDPATDELIPGMATDPVPRTYHSSAVLLPDGRVMAVGDNPGDGSFDRRISIYSPPYLVRGPRPQIQSLDTTGFAYGGTATVTVDRPIVRAGLIRPAAVTHSSDPNQRYVELPLTVNGSAVTLHVTSNPNIAPPGWYLLFVLDADGVPSVGRWVRVG